DSVGPMVRACSSVGQSTRLTSGRSEVRVLSRPRRYALGDAREPVRPRASCCVEASYSTSPEPRGRGAINRHPSRKKKARHGHAGTARHSAYGDGDNWVLVLTQISGKRSRVSCATKLSTPLVTRR